MTNVERTERDRRHRRICELIMDGKPLTVEFLSDRFGVSAMTIRRDLQHLEARGQLVRTRGGAEPVWYSEHEPFYLIRARENVSEKEAIARAAVELLNDREVIILDVGTTFLSLIHALTPIRDLTVMTNWIPNALELAKRPEVQTILLGGTLRKSELSCIGKMVEESLHNINADKAFIGVSGIDPVKGITDYNLDEVEIKRAMIRAAQEVIVLADHSKMGKVGPISIAPLSAVTTMVVDSDTSEEQCEMLRSHGIKVIIAPNLTKHE